MKFFFLLFFLLLAAIVATGGWVFLQSGTTPQQRMDRLYAFGERVVYHTARQGQERNPVEKAFDNSMGYCAFTRPVMPGQSAAGAWVIPDTRPLYSSPVLLHENGLLCGFPGGGKSVLFTPSSDISINVRRRPSEIPQIAVRDGEMGITSEKLAIKLLLPAMELTLTSAEPVNIAFADTQGSMSLVVIVGRVDISYRPTGEELSEARLMNLWATWKGSIFWDGKPLLSAGKMVQVSPTGLGEIRDAPNAPAPAGGPNPAPAPAANQNGTAAVPLPATPPPPPAQTGAAPAPAPAAPARP